MIQTISSSYSKIVEFLHSNYALNQFFNKVVIPFAAYTQENSTIILKDMWDISTTFTKAHPIFVSIVLVILTLIIAKKIYTSYQQYRLGKKKV